jgi:hypothetical protein
MKKTIQMLILLSLIFLSPTFIVNAQELTERPVVTIATYASSKTPSRGENFTLTVLFRNDGQKHARNIHIEFISGELIPRDNGGIQNLYQLNIDETKGIKQEFTVNADLWGASIANVPVNVEYSDKDGNTYTDSFTLAVDLHVPPYTASSATPTPTPTQILQPQLVIESYETDVDILQPGTSFELTMDVTNLGNITARAASMILGGGSIEVNPEGTPQPGISSGTGELANFAPLESSNVAYIGDIAPGETITCSQKIIVNVSTTPGAYSLKFSFIYVTEGGQKVVDDQSITLLIYQMPSLEIGFYQDTGPIYANQPNMLPLQIMNLGKKSVVLGNMQVTAEGAILENNIALVGPVEAGFYFTLDTIIIPESSGPLDVLISVKYNDDFNQPREYETTLTLDVVEPPMSPDLAPEDSSKEEIIDGEAGFPPGGDAGYENESFWQKISRFFKGLIGLDSGINQTGSPSVPDEIMPYEESVPAEPVKGW